MRHKVWTGLLTIVCVAGIHACGGDDDGGDSSEAGSGGSGGSRAGSGGSGASGSGASGSGGSGGSGASGSGGTGTMNPAGCPATAPTDGGACTMADIECTYGMMECDCDPAQGGGMMTWECSTAGGGMMQMCPATEPTSGGACTEGRGDCEYGDRTCDCENDAWSCWSPDDCPTMPPADGSACTIEGIECDYDVGGDDGECECEDSAWDCRGDFGEDEDGGV